MTVLRWDPWGEIAGLQRDINQLFARSAGSGVQSGLVPPVDAFRTDEGVVLRVELPGMRPEDVEVTVHDSVLTVRGERAADTSVPEEQWLRRERPVGAFERSFTLPKGTDAAAIAAHFDNGLLELRVPHPPERKPHRINVANGAGAQAISVDERPAQAAAERGQQREAVGASA